MARALALLLAACSLASGSGRDPVKAGRALFAETGCMACHAVGGVGGNVGPDLTLVGFRRPRAWLETWLHEPRSWDRDALMPDYKLTPASRAALVDYLTTLKGQGRKPMGRMDGKALYAKAGCVACHGPAGRGGEPNVNVRGGLIPALRGVAETYTYDELTAKIRRGSVPQKEDPLGAEPAAMPAWGQVLSEDEIGALAAYVLALAPQDKKAEW